MTDIGFTPLQSEKEGQKNDSNATKGRGKFRKIVEEAAEVGGGIVIGGLLENALKKIHEHATEKVLAGIKNHPAFQAYNDLRGEIFEDIRALEAEGEILSNLRRHLDQAQKDNQEYRMVHALGKIPKSSGKNGNRQAGLKWLNEQKGKKFQEMMNILESDNFSQFLLHFWAGTREVAKGLSKYLKKDLKKGKRWLDNEVAPAIDSFTDDRQEKQQARRMRNRESFWYSFFTLRLKDWWEWRQLSNSSAETRRRLSASTAPTTGEETSGCFPDDSRKREWWPPFATKGENQ